MKFPKSMIENPKDVAEDAIYAIYQHLGSKLEEAFGATSFIPVKYQREFISYIPISEECPIPSIFDKKDIRNYLADHPYPKQKYEFKVQFCWKDQINHVGYFKMMCAYPGCNSGQQLLKSNLAPVKLSKNIDFENPVNHKVENQKKIASYLVRQIKEI